MNVIKVSWLPIQIRGQNEYVMNNKNHQQELNNNKQNDEREMERTSTSGEERRSEK